MHGFEYVMGARPARAAGQPRCQLHFHVRPKPNAGWQIEPAWASKRLPLRMSEWLSGGQVAPLALLASVRPPPAAKVRDEQRHTNSKGCRAEPRAPYAVTAMLLGKTKAPIGADGAARAAVDVGTYRRV